MIKFIAEIYRKYMKGAKDNDFPISEYGILPSPSKAREVWNTRYNEEV